MTEPFANFIRVALCALVLATLLTSCGTSVSVRGSLPTPIVAPIELAVGLHFPDEFKGFVHEERIREQGKYKVDLGEQNYSFFSGLFESMFREVREVPAPPLADDLREGLAGVIVPTIETYGFLAPQLSGLEFFSASIEYRISIYDGDGVPLANWRVVGYGKSPSTGFSESAALGDATMLAIRDAGARIALEMAEQPEISKWIKSQSVQSD